MEIEVSVASSNEKQALSKRKRSTRRQLLEVPKVVETPILKRGRSKRQRGKTGITNTEETFVKRNRSIRNETDVNEPEVNTRSNRKTRSKDRKDSDKMDNEGLEKIKKQEKVRARCTRSNHRRIESKKVT